MCPPQRGHGHDGFASAVLGAALESVRTTE